MRCLLFLAGLLVPLSVPAQTPARAVLSMAEQPVRLIRGAAIYKAGAGVALQKDDILETGAAGAQVEAGANAILALGPQTRVLVLDLPAGGRVFDVALLGGWAKLMAAPGRVATAALNVTLPGGSTIVASQGDGKDAVFAEDGVQQAAKVEQGKAAAPIKLAVEQYAEVDPVKPQPVAGRPSRAFLGAMPPSFRDRLERVPNLANAGKVAPTKERDAGFDDVAPWLAARIPGVKTFVPRFRARLRDPAFRKPLERALGQQADWKAALQPPARPAASTLF